MSAQSYNSTSYSGYSKLTDKTGISPGFPLRDSSDYTRMIRERGVYKEQRSGEKVMPALSQTNSYDLAYAFGRVECAGCTAGGFLNVRTF